MATKMLMFGIWVRMAERDWDTRDKGYLKYKAPVRQKVQESLEPVKEHASLGIATNVTTEPLGFRAGLGVDLKGEWVEGASSK